MKSEIFVIFVIDWGYLQYFVQRIVIFKLYWEENGESIGKGEMLSLFECFKL